MKWFILIFLLAIQLRAQEVSLEDAYNSALKKNDYSSQNQGIRGQADAQYRVSRSYIFPQLSAVGTYEKLRLNNEDTNITTKDSQKLGSLVLKQSLFHGGLMNALDREKASQDIAKLTTKQNDLNLYSQVAQSYYHIQILEGSLDILNEVNRNSSKRVDILKKRVKIGKSQQTDLLTNQLQNNDIAVELRQTQADLDNERENFANLTTLPSSAKIKGMSGVTAVKPLQYYVDKAKNSMDLQIQQKNVFVAQKTESIASAQHLPTLDLSLAAEKGDISTTTRGTQYSGTVTLTFPLFQGGLVAAQADAAAMKKLEEQSKLNLLKTDLATQIKNQHAQLVKWVDLYKTYTDSIKIAEKNYRVSNREFELGLITNLDLLTSLNTYLTTKKNLDDAYFQMKMTELNLAKLVGERTL
jgi:outer membrane protein TolC